VTSTPPPAQQATKHTGSGDLLIWWLAPVVLVIMGLWVWSNHFDVQFHGDDFATIVNNRAIDTLRNIPPFFVEPRLESSEPDAADYRPLAMTWFAVDHSLARPNESATYQIDTFFWFLAAVFALYLAFRMLPGTDSRVALFGAALFGMHPTATEAVNYISQRGTVMAAYGVCLALALWIGFPRRLPRKLGIDLNRVPQNWWEDKLRTHGLAWERAYRNFLKTPIPFYLIPLLPALFCDPSATAFALLALLYVKVYEPEEGYRRWIVPGLICLVYWIVQTAIVLKASPLLRVPAAKYFLAQPWVAVLYLARFFAPWTISADSGYEPGSIVTAAIGFAGVALLIGCAVMLAKKEHWRGVSYGIWWFLAALVPTALIPQRAADANPRMFLAAAGLALAVAHMGGILLTKMLAREGESARIAAWFVAGLAGVGILGATGWMTHVRNDVWATEKSLWSDAIDKNPRSGKGYMVYASALIAEGDDSEGLRTLRKAVPLCEDNGTLQLGVARAFDRLNQDVDAELHFRRAIDLAPSASAYAYFGQWLLLHGRTDEAYTMSKKALALNSDDVVSRHTLIDLYSKRSDWDRVASLAKETLAINPRDTRGQSALTVATASIDQVHKAEQDAKSSSNFDDYLKLSVLYYEQQRYEDCARAAQEALKIRPAMAEAYANIATAMHALNRDDEAIAALREVIRLRPDMAFAKTDLEILLEKKAAEAARPKPN
jgi:tetratricopeptide (TPR) repeat protein